MSMSRVDAITHISQWYTKYLVAIGRSATDDAANVGPAIDAALLAMGVSSADLPTSTVSDEEGYRAQLDYHALRLIVRDLGADNFNVGLGGNSFQLEQIWKHAKEDLAEAKANVLAIFGTVTSGLANGGVVTMDLNYLDDYDEEETA